MEKFTSLKSLLYDFSRQRKNYFIQVKQPISIFRAGPIKRHYGPVTKSTLFSGSLCIAILQIV